MCWHTVSWNGFGPVSFADKFWINQIERYLSNTMRVLTIKRLCCVPRPQLPPSCRRATDYLFSLFNGHKMSFSLNVTQIYWITTQSYRSWKPLLQYIYQNKFQNIYAEVINEKNVLWCCRNCILQNIHPKLPFRLLRRPLMMTLLMG